MHNKFLINKKELTCLMVNMMTIKMFFNYPKNIITNAGNAAWIQTIYVSLIAILLYFIIMKIYERCDMKSIIEMSEEIGGKPLKIIVGLVIILLFCANVTVTMRSFPETVKNVLLPLTPMEIITIMLAIVIALAAYAGIGSLTRIHAIYIPFVGIILLMFLIFLVPYGNVTNIAPLFGKGTYNLLAKGLDSLSIFSDIFLIFILAPFFKNFDEIKKGGQYAIIISSIVSFLIVFSFNLIYAYPASEEFIFPVYQMTRLIRIGEFFQRLDAFFEFIWSIALMLYAAVYLFAIAYIWKEIFELTFMNALIVPFTIIIACLSFAPSSIVDLLNTGKIIYRITIPISFLLPVILGLVYRKKGHKMLK